MGISREAVNRVNNKVPDEHHEPRLHPHGGANKKLSEPENVSEIFTSDIQMLAGIRSRKIANHPQALLHLVRLSCWSKRRHLRKPIQHVKAHEHGDNLRCTSWPVAIIPTCTA
jgi:hypothetical protein